VYAGSIPTPASSRKPSGISLVSGTGGEDSKTLTGPDRAQPYRAQSPPAPARDPVAQERLRVAGQLICINGSINDCYEQVRDTPQEANFLIDMIQHLQLSLTTWRFN